MDFFHCNSCSHIPDFGDPRRYFLTSCGHVLCEPCYKRSGTACLVCKVPCKTVEIHAGTKDEIKMFFMDPMELLQNSLKQWAQVMKFQQAQMKSFKNQMNKMVESNLALRKELEAIKTENTMLHKKLEKLELKEQNWIGNGFQVQDFKPSQTSTEPFPMLSVSSTPRRNDLNFSLGSSDSQSQLQGQMIGKTASRGSGGHVQLGSASKSHSRPPSHMSSAQFNTPMHRASPIPLPRSQTGSMVGDIAPGRLTLGYGSPRTLRTNSPGSGSNYTGLSTPSTYRYGSPRSGSCGNEIISRLKQLRCRSGQVAERQCKDFPENSPYFGCGAH